MIFNLIKKDFKIVLSDKKALMILIAMPIVLFTILSVSLNGAFDDTNNNVWNIKIGIVKQYNELDDKENIKEILDQPSMGHEDSILKFTNILFDVLDSKELSFIEYEIMDLEKAKELLEANEIASIIVLPSNYIYDLIINMSPVFRKEIDIKIIKNNDQQYSSEIVENIVNEISNIQSQIMITNKIVNEVFNHYNIEKEIIDNVLKEIQNKKSKEIVVEINNYKIDKLKIVTSAQYYSVAMMTMFLLFGASYGAKFMLLEKKEFTLQRQEITGINSKHIVIGKMAIIYMISLMQIFLMIATSILVFNVYWGNMLSVFLLTLLVSLGITGLGAILASISLKINSLKAINILESGIFQLVALFGGSYFPIYLMPDWFKLVSKTLINGASLDAYLKVMMDVDLIEIIPSLVSIFLNGVIFLTIGMLLINSEGKKTKEVVRL